MKPATSEFLRQRFSEYYRTTVLVAPPSLPQREWGFVLFSHGETEMRMRRHIGFSDREECFGYIRNLVPQHAYYSSAYYETPDAGTMGEKGWCGADLIFDLDADHIMKGPYDQMLARVKEETEKLLAMLTGELGMDKKQVELVFSGGRGYHIHVRDLAFRGWGSNERRELIDYVCGIGTDPGLLLTLDMSVPGWPRRYRDTLSEFLALLGKKDPAEAEQYLRSQPGIGEKTAARLLADLPALARQCAAAPRELVFRGRMKDEALRALLAADEGEFKSLLRKRAALADEPVTTDTKRLIRLPTSLHGGSGMRVQPLELRALHDFDPLVDAVVFSTRDVRVDARFPLTMPMLGSTYQLQKGISTVPEAVAVFLCCRGIAEIA